MDKLNFGEIKKIVLFGGGQGVLDTAKIIKKNHIETFVFLSKNQSIDKNNLKKEKFYKVLKKNNIAFKILKSLKEKKLWQPHITKNTLGISNTCRWIFDKKDILFFKKRLINIHNSLLPSLAGGGGLSWNLMMSENFSGITFHFINENIDTGKIIMQKSYKFPKNVLSSSKKMRKFALEFEMQQINNFLKIIFNKKFFIYEKINHFKKEASYWPRLNTKLDAWIDWSWNSVQIINFIKAFSNPYEGAKTFLEKKVIKLNSAKLAKSKYNFHPFQSGLIYRIYKKSVFVACADGGIILDIKDFNKTSKLLGGRLYTHYKNTKL